MLSVEFCKLTKVHRGRWRKSKNADLYRKFAEK